MRNIYLLSTIFSYAVSNIETALKYKTVCEDWRDAIENYSGLMWHNLFTNNPFVIFEACSNGYYIVVKQWIKFRKNNNKTINIRFSTKMKQYIRKHKEYLFYENFLKHTYKCTNNDTLIYLSVFYNHQDITLLLLKSGMTIEKRVINLVTDNVKKYIKM